MVKWCNNYDNHIYCRLENMVKDYKQALKAKETEKTKLREEINRLRVSSIITCIKWILIVCVFVSSYLLGLFQHKFTNLYLYCLIIFLQRM